MSASQFSVEMRLGDTASNAELARGVETLCEVLRADLRSRGLAAKTAPPSDGILRDAVRLLETREPFRAICAWDAFPIEGLEYIGEDDDNGEPIPLRDCDGELVYIYGEPCFKLRVDTFAEVAV